MKARRVKKLDPAASLDENAARIVLVRLDELRSFVPRALEPEHGQAQHDMRIAAKRLRYVLEVTDMCFGEVGVVARRAARDLQGVLGDLHDCDVILPRVGGLDELAAHVQARRRSLHDRFRATWTAHEQEGTWDDLEVAARCVLDRAESHDLHAAPARAT